MNQYDIDENTGPFFFCDNYDACGEGWSGDPYPLREDVGEDVHLCDECYAEWIARDES